MCDYINQFPTIQSTHKEIQGCFLKFLALATTPINLPQSGVLLYTFISCKYINQSATRNKVPSPLAASYSKGRDGWATHLSWTEF